MTSRAVLTAAGALAIAGVGAGAGAGIYSAFAPATKTVVSTTTTVAGSQPVSATSGLSINAIYQRTYQGVVDMTVGTDTGFSPYGGGGGGQAEGSGFVYDKQGDIITNQHVVAGATSITITLWNGKTYKAKLVGSDSSTDLAVVRASSVPSSMLHPLTLGNSNNVQVGDPVIAIGSPFGLAETVTSGIVSALHRTMDAPNNYTIGNSIQTDAPINHGNSGGPLIDAVGHVIGVNAQIQTDGGGSNGVGFAIPSNTVTSVISQIVAGKPVAHAYLGISVDTSSSPQGAGVARVFAGQPAIKAGLRGGDVIVKLDDTVISNADDLSNVIDSKKPGDSLSVTYVRSGKQHTVKVTLATRPS